jgi:hypothetical protein
MRLKVSPFRWVWLCQTPLPQEKPPVHFVNLLSLERPPLHSYLFRPIGILFFDVRSFDPFVADALRRSALLARLIEQIQHSVGQCSELRESDPPLHLPATEPMATLFFTVKLINEFLVAL